MDHKNILNTGFCVLSKIKDFWEYDMIILGEMCK